MVPVDEEGGAGPTLISLAEHRRVLASGEDVPQQRPSVPLPLDEVGICNKTVWVRLDGATVPMKAAISVNLPGGRRGIHMSRMEEAISHLHREPFESLPAYGAALARHIVTGQEGSRCLVELCGEIPLFRNTRVSERSSLDSIGVDCRVDARLDGQEPVLDSLCLGVSVHHITACPCTQAYNRELAGEREGMPMPTHSQRSTTRLALTTQAEEVAVVDLHRCLAEALHLTSDLLKRPDEAEIVMSSHRRPQFAEDCVREVASSVWRSFAADLPGSTGVEIESLSLESIHIHDVRCRISTTLAAIGECLG